MPWGDGTGPAWGSGPGTGRRRGMGGGSGMGGGRRIFSGWTPPQSQQPISQAEQQTSKKQGLKKEKINAITALIHSKGKVKDMLYMERCFTPSLCTSTDAFKRAIEELIGVLA